MMKDADIVDLYWNREENAITETSKKYEAYLNKVAYNILQDLQDSQECVNDTYLKAWNGIPPNRPAVLSTFLAKITRRLAIDKYRKKKSQKHIDSEYAISLTEIEETLEGNSSLENVFDEKVLGEAINRFLMTLPNDARNAFIGRYYFFDPLKEVAAYCGMSEAKAKSLLYRTRIKLKEYLQKEGFAL